MQASSRRSFLKVTALAGLAASLPSFGLSAKEEESLPEAKPSKEKGLVFLFQGDSITDGNRGRDQDPNHIMGHGYAFSVASRIGADFPELDLTFYNRGISGNGVPDLQKRWQADAIDLKPDVLSILVGINDVHAYLNNPAEAPGVEDFERGYRQLLTASKAANPDILLVLGIPFVYPVGWRKDQFAQWQTETEKRARVVRGLAGEFGALLVDYPAAFDKAMKRKAAEYWIWDGIHPTVFGHEIMAREWIGQLSTRLKFLRKYR